MAQDNRGLALKLVPLLLIIFVAGLYAGYAITLLSPKPQVVTNDTYLMSRIGALEGQVAALQGEIGDLQRRNATIQLGSLDDVYSSVKDSIVTVSGLTSSTDIFGSITYSEVLGSGFVVNLTGEPLIMTNYHVVDGMINGSITFLDGEAYSFTVIGLDKYSDLAVLYTSAPSEKLKPLTVVSSSSLRVGDSVIAIGNPFGLQSTLTSGIVSQLARAIQTETAGSYNIAGVIQISTPINPGNSGGPLFDILGRVVGITTAIISGSQNVGFAVPSDAIIREINSLVRTGGYSHPYIGVSGYSLNYLAAKVLNINVTYGVLIQSVTPGGPAEAAGIRAGTFNINVVDQRLRGGGDVIVAVDSIKIKIMDDLSAILDTKAPGETVEMTVLRNGDYVVVLVTLGIRP